MLSTDRLHALVTRSAQLTFQINGDRGLEIMTRTHSLLSLLAVSTGLLFLGGRQPSSATPHRQFVPKIRRSTGKTLNWAGYVTQNDLLNPLKQSVTDVRGSWRVPAVTSSGTLDTASAIWVGIDGNSSKTVEQIGTEQDWTSGTPVYYAWFEM